MKKLKSIIERIHRKINIKELLLIFLIAQPFLDIYLKVVGERFDIFGFSLTTLIRIAFVVFALVYILMTRKDKKDFILIGGYLLLVCIYAIIHIYNGQNFYNNFAIGNTNGIIKELLYILRLTLPILLLYCVYKEGVNIKRISKYISATAIIISSIIVITNIFKVSFVAYSLDYDIIDDNIFSWFSDGYEKHGYVVLTSKGWFYEANCISAVLVFTFPILLYNAMKTKKWFCYIGIQLQIIAMLMLGSRTASYGWILVYVGYMFFYLLFNAVKKRKYDYTFISLSIAIMIISVAVLNYSPIKMRQIENEKYLAKYNENMQNKKNSDKDAENPVNDIIYNVMYKGDNPIKYVEAVNNNLIEVSNEYSRQEVQELIDNNDNNGLRKYVEVEYIRNNYNDNFISAFFINEVYPYAQDTEFWLKVLDMPFYVKSDNRGIEKLLVARLKEKNDNFVMDTLFGLNDTALKSRGYVVETDFYNHYYTIGIVGIIILFGPYIIVLGYCGIKILLDIRNKFTMGNVMYGLSLLAAMAMGYLSGHLMDEYITLDECLLVYLVLTYSLKMKTF